MKKSPTLFLQIIIVLAGISALVWMLWVPHLEGRNIHATFFKVYLNDPFLIYAYTASICFFVTLYQAFKLLGYIRRNEIFSEPSVKALRIIRYCAITFVVFVLGGEAYLGIIQRTKDDIAGGVFMGLLLIIVAGITATVATVFEKTLQGAVDIKSENDLTV